MLAVVSTQPHPYHLQVLGFWLSIGPVVALIGLVVFTIVWQRRRAHRRRRSA